MGYVIIACKIRRRITSGKTKSIRTTDNTYGGFLATTSMTSLKIAEYKNNNKPPSYPSLIGDILSRIITKTSIGTYFAYNPPHFPENEKFS